MTVINALLPIVFLLSLGAYLKRIRLLDEAFWPSLERLTYYILAPCLIVHGLASKSLDSLPWQNAVLVIYGTLFIAAGLLWVGRFLHNGVSPERFTSMFQGGVRFNAYACLALVQGLYGTEGLVIGSLIAGFMITLINLLCVSTFAVTLPRDGNVILSALTQLAKNPLILACLIGLSVNLSGLPLPSMVLSSLSILGKAALPTALLAVGAALDLSTVLHDLRLSSWVGFVQFAVKPACALLGCYFLGLNGVTAAVVVVFMASPTAPSSYLLARQLGGDYKIMASMIAQQTVFALISVPLTIWMIDAFIPMPGGL